MIISNNLVVKKGTILVIGDGGASIYNFRNFAMLHGKCNFDSKTVTISVSDDWIESVVIYETEYECTKEEELKKFCSKLMSDIQKNL